MFRAIRLQLAGQYLRRLLFIGPDDETEN